MTYVGTVRANKKEVPGEMKDVSSREEGSSAFLFTDNMIQVSYVATSSKKKKNVLLLSSMHTLPSLGNSGKPEVIEFYNSTKGGVDALDQMCAIYSYGRSTQRWPMCIFYGMINIGGINVWVIYSENTTASLNRRKFMQAVAKAFIKPWAQQRLSAPTLPISLRNIMNTVCEITQDCSQKVVTAESRFTPSYCKKCPAKKRRKTRFHCTKCDLAVCLSHCYPLSPDCESQ
ncbi:piggyBac transposable element-derived protein 4-like [Macrobrachium rosenbergii]|uniref:piggyBac transposable element-derived protein 4-like n=1 Tax=Macrobrachium rosenbergii TaxID=79674 RepID=UPI0034D54F25